MTRLSHIVLAYAVLVSTAIAGLPKVNLPLPQFSSDVRITDLTCEYRCDPLGIDVTEPRLSWKLQSPWRGQKQTAYQLIVATSEKLLAEERGDLWDTGKVTSDRSIFVRYAGKPLVSRQRCFWKVRIWDKDDQPSSFSSVAYWEMGLLDKSDWKGKWIAAPLEGKGAVDSAPFLRKTFALSKEPVQGRLYVCGLGYYEAHLNGGKVGDRVLDPAFTRYDRRALYSTYDVSDQLTEGLNVVGVLLGNGWYNVSGKAAWDFNVAPWRGKPTAKCQLEVTFADGSKRTFASDQTWRVGGSPIVYNEIRQGESYDARREVPGWDTAEVIDANWPLVRIDDGPGGIVSAQMNPPIKVTRTIDPVKLTEPKPGVYVFDLGQNIAGWARLKVSGPAGTKVTLRYGERIHEDGSLDQKDIAVHVRENRFSTDEYILRGEGVETWEPRFVYHGFQYVEVTGLSEKPTLDMIQGRVVRTAFDRAGSFECSNPLINKIQRATLWAYIGNFHGYPTDCPHREKNGWTGDAHLAAEVGLYNFNSAPAYTKWMMDLKDEQKPTGELPGIVPTGGWGYAWGNGPAWDSAYVLIPWYMYEYCGDTGILAEHYERLKRYVDYLTSKAENGIVSIGLNDWAPAKSTTPANITSTGYYYRDALVVSKIARLLGKNDEAQEYGDLALSIREAFNREFLDAEVGIYRPGTQTAMSCALYHGLVPPEHYQKVLDNLVAMIEKNDGHLDAGILGTKYLIDALTAGGRADVVYEMSTKTTFPSWGRWIEQGATTLWEQWNGGASRNHIMFGHIGAWYYQVLGGIRSDPEAVGFKHVIVKPQLLGDITWVRAEHESMYGPVKSYWDIHDDAFTLKVAIPTNTTATVYVPSDRKEFTREGPDYIHSGDNVRFVGLDGPYVVFEAQSGTYEFNSKLTR